MISRWGEFALLDNLFFPEKELEVDNLGFGGIGLVDNDSNWELYGVFVQAHNFEELTESLRVALN